MFSLVHISLLSSDYLKLTIRTFVPSSDAGPEQILFLDPNTLIFFQMIRNRTRRAMVQRAKQKQTVALRTEACVVDGS